MTKPETVRAILWTLALIWAGAFSLLALFIWQCWDNGRQRNQERNLPAPGPKMTHPPTLKNTPPEN